MKFKLLFFLIVAMGINYSLFATLIVDEYFKPEKLKEWSCYQQRGGKVKLHAVIPNSARNGFFLLVCNGDIYNKYNDFIALYRKIDQPLDVNSRYKLSIVAKAVVNYRAGKKFCVALRQLDANKKTISYKKVYVELKKSEQNTYSLEIKPDPKSKKYQLYLISHYLTAKDKIYIERISLKKLD
jgi:hypothetical protein